MCHTYTTLISSYSCVASYLATAENLMSPKYSNMSCITILGLHKLDKCHLPDPCIHTTLAIKLIHAYQKNLSMNLDVKKHSIIWLIFNIGINSNKFANNSHAHTIFIFTETEIANYN